MKEHPLDDAELIFGLAHDLRGYLRTVLTRIQLVQKGAASVLPEQESGWLSEAGSAAEDMNRLIGAVVSYYGVAAAPETMGLRLMLRGLRVENQAMLSEAGAELLIPDPVDVDVSRALATVLDELLTNACRFRRREMPAEIRITTRMPDSSHVEIVMADNGSGVNPEYLDRIFQPFRRLHSRSEYPGFGLGLALCRRIVTANDGVIEASVPSDGGFSVRIVLPVQLIPG